MNRLTELKQKTPSFGLRKRRSRRVSARGLASCGSISGSCFVRRAYEQTNVGLQPVVGQRLKEAVKKRPHRAKASDSAASSAFNAVLGSRLRRLLQLFSGLLRSRAI